LSTDELVALAFTPLVPIPLHPSHTLALPANVLVRMY